MTDKDPMLDLYEGCERRERIAITDPADLDVEIEGLKAKVARLRGALQMYGEHDLGCPRYSKDGELRGCNCVLSRVAVSGDSESGGEGKV